MPGPRHHGFLAQGGAGGHAGDEFAAGMPQRLITQQAPDRLDEEDADMFVAMPVNAVLALRSPAAVFAGTTTGVTARGFAMFEPLPVAPFAVHQASVNLPRPFGSFSSVTNASICSLSCSSRALAKQSAPVAVRGACAKTRRVRAATVSTCAIRPSRRAGFAVHVPGARPGHPPRVPELWTLTTSSVLLIKLSIMTVL